MDSAQNIEMKKMTFSLVPIPEKGVLKINKSLLSPHLPCVVGQA
jgi:hypothetical protein